MTITLGRASLAGGFSAVSHNDDQVSLSFNILPATLAEAKVLRQQVLGLANNADEPVVPITDSNDSDIDGFYRVLGASVSPVQSYLTNKLMRCEVALERVGGGFSRPEFEISIGSIVRTNGHTITAPQTIMSTRSGSHLAYDENTTGLTNLDGVTRETSDGTDMFLRLADGAEAIRYWRFWGEPKDHYDGAATIEVRRGSTWHIVAGRQIGVITDEPWRISNGIVRLTSELDTGSGNTLEFWDDGASAWDVFPVGLAQWDGGSIQVLPIGGPGGGFDGVYSWAITRNSVERVVLTVAAGVYRFDFSVARGAQHVEITWNSPSTGFNVWGVDIGAASTAVTGGIRRTSASGDGNYLVGAVAAADSNDLTNGYVYPTSAVLKSGSMMIGVADDLTASEPNEPNMLIEQFIGVSPVYQIVTER